MSKIINNTPPYCKISNYPEEYDLLHQDFDKELHFYLDLTKSYNEILEIGVGTGRLTIPLAKAGKKIVGIDYSEKMLRGLKLKLEKENMDVRNRVKLFKKDMRDFDLKKKFKFIFIPFMTFNYLLDIDSQIDCLNCLYKQLHDKGMLFLELISYYPEWFVDDQLPRLVARRIDLMNNQTVSIFRIVRFDASNQLLEHDRIYKYYDEQGHFLSEKFISLKNRFMFLGEVKLLLNNSKFKIKSIYGDYDKSSYDKKSRVMLIVVTK